MAKRKTIINRMDGKARGCTYLRDGGVCQKCGGDGCDTHHIRKRKYYSTRWNLTNLIYLCRSCHSGAESNPTEFAEWFNRKYPHRKKAIEWFAINGKKDTWRDSDLKEIEDYLDEKLKELK